MVATPTCLLAASRASSSSFTDLDTFTRGLFLIVFALEPNRIVDVVSAVLNLQQCGPKKKGRFHEMTKRDSWR